MAGDVPNLEERRLSRAALARWAVPAKSFVNQVILFQVLAAAGWVCVAWGIGQGAAGVAAGKPSNLFFVTALAGAALRTVFLRLGDHFSARAGIAMSAAARREIFSALAKSGAALLAGAGSGERTAQIIDRTAKLHRYAAHWLPGQRVAIAAPVVILVAAAAQSWLVAALLALSVAVLPLFIWLTASRTSEAARAQQASLESLAGVFQSVSAHAGLIRAFRSIGREATALRLASEELRARTMGILRIAFLTSAVLDFFASISIAVVAVYVGFKLLGVFPFPTGETVTLAEGLMALILAPEYFAPIRRLSGLHHDRADGVAAASGLASWLNASAGAPAIRRLPKLSGAPRIVFSDVALSYGAGEAAVSGVSFAADAGEIVALSGASGSGKSTCLLALIGRAQLRAGRIEVDGHALRSGDSLADGVAFIRQSPWLIEGSLAENIALANPGASLAQVETAAAAGGVAAFIEKTDEGLDRRLERFGAGLSGGQKQRITIARAVVREAPLWLLDEPTAHLDAESEAAFLGDLRRLAAGRTVLVATHSEAVAAACDRVVQMPSRRRAGARA